MKKEEMEEQFVAEGYFRILIGLIATPIMFIISVILLVVTLVQKFYEPYIIGVLLFMLMICTITFLILLHFWKKRL